MKKVGILCAGDRELAPFLAVRSITDTSGDSGTEAFERNCARASDIAAEVTVR